MYLTINSPKQPFFPDHRFLGRFLAIVMSTASVFGQAPPAGGPTQTLDAELVLTNEFCATKVKQGSLFTSPEPLRKESFAVGQVACEQLEPALRYAYRHLARIGKEPTAETNAQIVLVPKFVSVNATTPGGFAPAFSDRELVVMIEWTAKDRSGKTIWVETVQGKAVAKLGNLFTQGGNRKRIIQEAVHDLASTSARKMSDSVELRKIAQP